MSAHRSRTRYENRTTPKDRENVFRGRSPNRKRNRRNSRSRWRSRSRERRNYKNEVQYESPRFEPPPSPRFEEPGNRRSKEWYDGHQNEETLLSDSFHKEEFESQRRSYDRESSDIFNQKISSPRIKVEQNNPNVYYDDRHYEDDMVKSNKKDKIVFEEPSANKYSQQKIQLAKPEPVWEDPSSLITGTAGFSLVQTPIQNSSGRQDNFRVSSPSTEAEPTGPLIPEFNPETSKLSARQWIKLIDEVAQKNNWEIGLKKYHLTSRLAGFARQWYLTSGKNITRWQELRNKFISAFPSDVDFAYQLQEMLSRVKTDEETMESYFTHKVALLNSCDITGVRAVSCITTGIKDSVLRKQLRVENFSDPDTLYAYLLRNKPETMVSANVKNSVPKSLETKSKATKVCHMCKEVGHQRNCCPKRNDKKCSICNRYGHHKDTCVRNEQNTVVEPNNHIMFGALGNINTYTKYYKNVEINGMVFNGYVDMGSECVTIREEAARELNLQPKKNFRVVRGFGGSSVSVLAEADVMICVDRAVANVKAYIVPDHVQAIAVVVGQSFTVQPHVVAVKEGESIYYCQRMDNGGPF